MSEMKVLRRAQTLARVEGGIETIRQAQTRSAERCCPFFWEDTFLQGEYLILICVEQHGNEIERISYSIVCPLPFIRGVGSHPDGGCIM